MTLLLRVGTRLTTLVLLLFGGLATVFVVYPFVNLRRRDHIMQIWSRWLVSGSGVEIRLSTRFREAPLHPDTYGQMLVANHISWLDIFVINAVAPSCFIAKSDIAGWPVVGTLVSRVGTLFLERGKRHAVHDMIRKVTAALADGRRIAVFPEGTTGDGSKLLPFHGNIMEAALHANTVVVPVGIRYIDDKGRSASANDGPVNFVGEISFVQSVLRIVQAPSLIAEVYPLPPASAENEPQVKKRHALAQSARLAISQALALPLEDNLPEVVRDLRVAPR